MVIYKQHHSMCDGVSVISHHLSHGDGYDVSALIPIKKVSFLQRLILRVSFPLYVPGLIYRIMTTKQDRNPLHDGKRVLSGKRKAGTTSDLKF